MDAHLVFDFLVVISLVSLAAGCVFVRDLSRSTVLFMVFGLIMALAWARLRAPDVAITEAALGAGLIGALVLKGVRAFREDQLSKRKRLEDADE